MESLTNISNLEPQGLIYARYLETIKNLNGNHIHNLIVHYRFKRLSH